MPYTDKSRGLYLHGINYNTVELYTLPSSTVQQVAKTFGFHVTEYKLFETLKEVKQFGDEMQLTGLYDDREVEGAVVRCKRNGKDFFFKIKNKQYMMYREFREVTNAILQVKEDGTLEAKPKKDVRITFEKTHWYILWLHKRIVDKPEWFKEFKMHRGIIFVRIEFEKYWETGNLSELE